MFHCFRLGEQTRGEVLPSTSPPTGKMKRIILLVSFLLLFASFVFGDVLRIPFDCYPLKLQARFAEYGLKLDLNGIERTEASWGFLKNEGSHFVIYTYCSASTDELNLVMEIIQSQYREE